MEASKNWKENIAVDEEEKYAKYAKIFSIIQKTKSKEFGNGRSLHRKQILGTKVKLEIFDSIPEFAKSGIFKSAKTFEGLVRLSNGGMAIESDSKPDIRGFAIRLNVEGESALGGNTTAQCFLMINQDAFIVRDAEGFVNLVGAVASGGKSLLKYLWNTYGIFGIAGQMIKMKNTFGKKFTGFATEKFSTVLPISCGEYACKARIVPSESEKINHSSGSDFSKDMKDRLKDHEIEFDFELQFFINDEITPIEKADILWEEKKSPFIKVGKLTLLKEDFDSEEFQKSIEANAFDPWLALKEHKPLGTVMRARKVVYFQSLKNRSK
jgi:catalase